MPIYQDSRYEDAPVTPVQGSDGVFRATIQPFLGEAELNTYTVHQVTDYDSITQLAFAAYGDTELWWRIADANPELGYPDELPVGMLLRIPVTTATDF